MPAAHSPCRGRQPAKRAPGLAPRARRGRRAGLLPVLRLATAYSAGRRDAAAPERAVDRTPGAGYMAAREDSASRVAAAAHGLCRHCGHTAAQSRRPEPVACGWPVLGRDPGDFDGGDTQARPHGAHVAHTVLLRCAVAGLRGTFQPRRFRVDPGAGVAGDVVYRCGNLLHAGALHARLRHGADGTDRTDQLFRCCPGRFLGLAVLEPGAGYLVTVRQCAGYRRWRDDNFARPPLRGPSRGLLNENRTWVTAPTPVSHTAARKAETLALCGSPAWS